MDKVSVAPLANSTCSFLLYACAHLVWLLSGFIVPLVAVADHDSMRLCVHDCRPTTLHSSTLHYTSLHCYTRLHYTTLHRTTLHHNHNHSYNCNYSYNFNNNYNYNNYNYNCTTLITLHYTALHYNTHNYNYNYITLNTLH